MIASAAPSRIHARAPSYGARSPQTPAELQYLQCKLDEGGCQFSESQLKVWGAWALDHETLAFATLALQDARQA